MRILIASLFALALSAEAIAATMVTDHVPLLISGEVLADVIRESDLTEEGKAIASTGFIDALQANGNRISAAQIREICLAAGQDDAGCGKFVENTFRKHNEFVEEMQCKLSDMNSNYAPPNEDIPDMNDCLAMNAFWERFNHSETMFANCIGSKKDLDRIDSGELETVGYLEDSINGRCRQWVNASENCHKYMKDTFERKLKDLQQKSSSLSKKKLAQLFGVEKKEVCNFIRNRTNYYECILETVESGGMRSSDSLVRFCARENKPF